MIEVGLKFRRNHNLRCKHLIVYIPRRKHLRECWLQWIVGKYISEYLFCYLLNETRVWMPQVSDIFLPQLIHQQLKSSKSTATARYAKNSRSDATCASVTCSFSLCKFSVVFSPLFQALKSFVSYNNQIQKKLIALNKKNTWTAHFFDRARKKIVYTGLTTLRRSALNSSAQLTYTRAVL